MKAKTLVDISAEKTSKYEDFILDQLKTPAIQAIIGSITLQTLGESRTINRDLAGFLFATWIIIQAARVGITDKYALGALWTAAGAAYSLMTPVSEGEGLVDIDLVPSSLNEFFLGKDNKFFFWSASDIANIFGIGR